MKKIMCLVLICFCLLINSSVILAGGSDLLVLESEEIVMCGPWVPIED